MSVARRGRLGLVIWTLTLLATPPPVPGAEEASLVVRYVSADAVYLDGGRRAGLEVGDRLEVVRDGAVIAGLVVVYTAEHTASCEVVEARVEVRPGDRVRPTEPLVPAPSATPPEAPAPAAPAERQEPRPVTPARPAPTVVHGIVSAELEAFSDASGDRDYDRTALRLDVRGRTLGGLPLSLDLRLRAREDSRTRALTAGPGAAVSRDRLYAAALTWAPEGGRYRLSLGRLGTRPFTGIGFLDGAVAEVDLTGTLTLGAFGGSRPEVADLGFESGGAKLGAYLRLRPEEGGFEALVGGVREDGELDVSREYAVLETAYRGGGVWSFHQRAELDLHTGWRREIDGSSSQLSNLSLAASARFAPGRRLLVSYHLFEPYRTEATRFVPERLFDDLTRQGLRATLHLGRPDGWGTTWTVGYRDKEGEEEAALSFGGGVRRAGLAGGRLGVGADLLGFTGPLSDGTLLTLRGDWNLDGGHQVGVTLGGSARRDAFETDASTAWVRLDGWVELPRRLFARSELEVSRGDDLDGERLIVGLGYRF